MSRGSDGTDTWTVRDRCIAPSGMRYCGCPCHDSQPETAMTDTPRPEGQKAQDSEAERLRREAHDAFHAYSQSAPGPESDGRFKACVAAIDALADLAKRLERERDAYHEQRDSVVAANDESLRERDEARRQLKDHRCTLPDSINEALNSGDGVYRP